MLIVASDREVCESRNVGDLRDIKRVDEVRRGAFVGPFIHTWRNELHSELITSFLLRCSECVQTGAGQVNKSMFGPLSSSSSTLQVLIKHDSKFFEFLSIINSNVQENLQSNKNKKDALSYRAKTQYIEARRSTVLLGVGDRKLHFEPVLLRL
jgi:hypothetical protein